MAEPFRTRPYRYNKAGEVLPPLSPAPLKKSYTEQRTRQLKQRPADYVEQLEQRRRQTQRDVARVDDNQAREFHGLFVDLCVAGDYVEAGRLLQHLTTQRPSLRRRFVELVRYEATQQTNTNLAKQLHVAGNTVEAAKFKGTTK
jgi:hypothetical protein